jgi:hypothetical protein
LSGTTADVDGGGPLGFVVTSAALNSYEVFTEVNCQFIPKSVAVSGVKIFGGSGKYEKYARKNIDDIQQSITVEQWVVGGQPLPVANSFNPFQRTGIKYASTLTVKYAKGGYLDWSPL